MNGAGTLILSDASNSYMGGNTLTAGTLSVGADADLGAAANGVTFNGGALRDDGDVHLGADGDGGRGRRHVHSERRDDADAVGDADRHRGAGAERVPGWSC